MGSILKSDALVESVAIADFVLPEWQPAPRAAIAAATPPQPAVPARDWDAEIAAAGERGRKAGHAEGLAAGRAQERKELQQAFAAAAALAAELTRARQESLVESEQALVRLALAIARKIVLQESRHSEALVRHCAKAAISQLAERQQLTIRVHPEDLPHLRGVEESLATLGLSGGGAQVVGDEFIAPGGCVVQSPTCMVDADLRTQLDEIERQLLRHEHADTNESG